jgi:hypothetical protein
VDGGAAVGVACGLHAVTSKTIPTNTLKIRRVGFIFSPFEFEWVFKKEYVILNIFGLNLS